MPKGLRFPCAALEFFQRDAPHYLGYIDRYYTPQPTVM